MNKRKRKKKQQMKEDTARQKSNRKKVKERGKTGKTSLETRKDQIALGPN
jgi:hypothetical protein